MAAANALELPILDEINIVRRRHGLRPLGASVALRRAADEHAVSMARKGYFSHTSADGTQFDARIARHYGCEGFTRCLVGENLLWSSPAVSPAEAVRRWMESPRHRRVILTGELRQIGIAAVRATAAPGHFEGLDVTIVVTDFGARS